jgi:branched-chain amino acid transport system ATP-binding protein
VLQDVDLDVPEGQVTALLGPNGAGKSSLVLALAGLLPAEAGTVRLGKQELLGERPEAVRAVGLAAVPEGHRVLTKLTVEENVRVAAGKRSRGDIERAWAVFPELVPLRDRTAGTLSGGEQQMLALAQAIVGGPRVILADEMSLGLTPLIVRRLVEVVADLATEGIGSCSSSSSRTWRWGWPGGCWWWNGAASASTGRRPTCGRGPVCSMPPTSAWFPTELVSYPEVGVVNARERRPLRDGYVTKR